MCSAGRGGSGTKGANIGEPAMISSVPGIDPRMVSAADGDANMAKQDMRTWAVTLPAELHVGGLDRDVIVTGWKDRQRSTIN